MKQKRQDASYFSMDNLNELSGIEDHLRYAETLINTYSGDSEQNSADAEQWKNFRSMIENIRRKQNDKKLNISVIGEFSTGKSTFINALLRQELLISSALQGTTLASTILEYDRRYTMQVKAKNAPEFSKSFSGFAPMKIQLDHYTTDPALAQKLESVQITLPSPFLENQVRIIDTPGTNATDVWHEEVTIRALNDLSDLSIILIAAEKPAPETFLAFLRKNLSSVLSQCVFVVTQLDRIRRPKERKRQLDYIKRRLETELELEDVVVLPYVSTMVLGDTEERPIEEELLQASFETERLLLQHTARQKTVAQTKKLVSLMDSIYTALNGQIQRISHGYEEKLKRLEKSAKVDLESFVERQIMECERDFDKQMSDDVDNLKYKLAELAENASESVLDKLDDKTTLDSLKDYLCGSSLKGDCLSEAQEIMEHAQGITPRAQKQFKSERKRFEQRFQELYQEYDILPVNIRLAERLPDSEISNTPPDFSNTASYITEEVSRENWAVGAGGAIGATIGTMLLPGLGTVIGGLIGVGLGCSNDDHVYEVRSNCKGKLQAPLSDYFETVQEQAESSIDDFLESVKMALASEFRCYLQAYRNEVNRQIREENAQRANLQKKINVLESELKNLQNRRKALESVNAQLDKLTLKATV